jgi:hypothetical protein
MIETLQDVKMFITTLITADMLWHADDLVCDIPNFSSLTKPEKLQEMMNDAINVCAEHNCSIFDFYPETE